MSTIELNTDAADAELLRAAIEAKRLSELHVDLCRAKETGGATEEEVKSCSAEHAAVAHRLAELQARSLEGVLAKIRLLAEGVEYGKGPWDEALAAGLIRDVEAMAGRAAA